MKGQFELLGCIWYWRQSLWNLMWAQIKWRENNIKSEMKEGQSNLWGPFLFLLCQIEGAGSNYWHHLSVRQWFSLQFPKIQLEDSLDGHKAVFSIWVRNMSDRVPILAVGLKWASLSIRSCFVLFHQALYFTLIALGCRWW